MEERTEIGPLGPGSIVGGRYRLVKQLGEGGMGRVFLADDLRLEGKRWAVKWVPKDGVDPDQAEKEAKIMTSLQHPSLPRIADYIHGDAVEGCCIVMDYLEGETLQQRSAAGGGHRMHWRTVVSYAVQLCDLLMYLHNLDSPVVFRDIKPSNVIVGADDKVRLIDFGIARTFKPGQSNDTVHVGSVGFAAPELLANRQTDHRADLYSLGSLIYYLISGGQYYNFSKLPVEQTADGIPPELADTVRLLLETDPDKRMSGARQAREQLIKAASMHRLNDFPETRHLPKSAGGPNKRTIVSVYGLFPHSGATFVSVTLAKLLSARNLNVAYCEFPWQTADSLLAMFAAMKGHGAGRREGTLVWNIRRTVDAEGVPPFELVSLYKMLLEAKEEIVLYDISSSALPEAAEAMIRSSDLVIAVASPEPAGLRSDSAVANWKRVGEMAGEGRVCWVANRMPRTVGLSEFYKLFSTGPTASIPELDYDRMMEAKWRGQWLIDERQTQTFMHDRMETLLRVIVPELKARTGIRGKAQKWLAKTWPIDYTE